MSPIVRSLLALLLCATLASCGQRERDVDTAAAQGILILGNGTEPKTLDPHLATGVPENKIISALIEGLIANHPTDDSQPAPGMAESWEHNGDYTVWRFRLRDAKWTNGDPVTANDFVYSWQRILSPRLGAEYAKMLYVIRGAEEYHSGRVTDFNQVGVRAIDPRTLEVTLKGPTPHFLLMLKHYSFFPVNPRAVNAAGGQTDRASRWSTVENYVGNGPFRLKRWVTNQIVEVERNPTYWDAATVKLNGIRFMPIENVSAELTAFQAGRLHKTNEVPADRIPSLRQQMPQQLRMEPYLGTYFYRLNVTRAPFNDPRVRQALSLAIDNRAIVERVTQGGQAPSTGFVPKDMSGWPVSDKIRFDPARARQLLAEAGFPGGRGFPAKEILINTSEAHRRIAEAIQAMWREHLGINVGVFNQEWKVYLDSQSNLNYDISRAGWIADYVHPLTMLEIWTTGNGNNDTGWSNPRYDQLIRSAQTAPDEAQRSVLLKQAEDLLLTELPVLPIYWYTRVYLIDPRVQGWNPKVLDNRPYKYISFAPAA